MKNTQLLPMTITTTKFKAYFLRFNIENSFYFLILLCRYIILIIPFFVKKYFFLQLINFFLNFYDISFIQIIITMEKI